MAGQKMLRFVTVGRDMPPKREAEARRADFGEIYADFARDKAAEQAARCSQCGVPFCQTHCPLHNNIPDWLRLTAEGRLQEAYELAQATSTFPEVCGRICPQDRLCEGNCVIEQSGHGTVTIGSVERFITDTAWAEGWVKPIVPLRERTESVGVIGAGPAGLSAADYLRRLGVQVTGLRPPRPRGRAHDLRHPRLQAREGRGGAAHRAVPPVGRRVRAQLRRGRHPEL
jgi:glutamate synthase (NADPH/NADH) small chain